jgi:hypothetical protein
MYASSRRCSLAVAICCGLLVAGCGAGDSVSSGDGSGGSSGTGGTATGGSSGTGGGPGAGAGSGGLTGSSGDVGPDGGGPSGGSPGTGGAAGAAGASGSGGVRAGQGGATSGGGRSGIGGGGGRAAGGAGAGQGGATSGGGRSGVAGAGGRAGAGASAGASGATGPGGAGGLGPNAPGGRVTGYGTVLFSTKSSSQIVRLQTSMLVPPEPPASGTLFLWPGLQPNGANFDPINNGVLQPVLTWGPSCAPGKQPRAYSTWWISGQYVNTFGSEPGYTGCQGGPVMSVAVNDVLDLDMALAGTIWTQTVMDVQTGQSVAYSLDMKNQSQNLAYFVIEEYSSAPVSEVVFSDITITFGGPDAADCKLAMRGQNDYVSVPVPSSDGRSCTIQEIILRAQGVP